MVDAAYWSFSMSGTIAGHLGNGPVDTLDMSVAGCGSLNIASRLRFNKLQSGNQMTSII